jgi:transcription antitermination factor NusG
MMYILATTRTNHEFATADAINEMGALAVVPRKVTITPAKDGQPERIDYSPLLPRMLFVACGEDQWHHMQAKRLHGLRGILPPIRRQFDIIPRTWDEFKKFAQAAEQECAYRIGMHEAGHKVRSIRPNDIIKMIEGHIGDYELAGRMGRVIKVEGGKVHVKTDIEIMGKPVTARLDPQQVQGIAAE